MEFFNNANRERLISIAENYIDSILEDRENSNIEDLASAFSNAGLTKSEFFAILDKYYLNDYNWAEETVPVPNIEGINAGDTDQTIFEATLTRLGIPYTWKESNDSKGRWIDVKMVDKEKSYEEDIVAALVHFNKEGGLMGIF